MALSFTHRALPAQVVEVVHAGGDSQRMHALWLRDNCRCDLCVHASSLQKRGIVATLPPDLAPVEAAIGDGLVRNPALL